MLGQAFATRHAAWRRDRLPRLLRERRRLPGNALVELEGRFGLDEEVLVRQRRVGRLADQSYAGRRTRRHKCLKTRLSQCPLSTTLPSSLLEDPTTAVGRERPLGDPLASGSFGGHIGRAWLSGVLVRASAPPRVQRHHHAERTGDLARTGSSGPDVTALHHSNQTLLLRMRRSRV